MGDASPTRRLVDEYARAEPGKPYQLARKGVEFAAYMRENGYHIIPVAGADQLARPLNTPGLFMNARDKYDFVYGMISFQNCAHYGAAMAFEPLMSVLVQRI